MTPVLVALYDDYGIAERVRTQLVSDGFPTDRVELTSKLDSGQAGTQPGDSFGERVSQYFHVLFDQTADENYATFFAEGVKRGCSAVTVHPRSEDEIESARSILQSNGPVDIDERTAEWKLNEQVNGSVQ